MIKTQKTQKIQKIVYVEKEQYPLAMAAAEGDLEAIRHMVRSGADINKPGFCNFNLFGRRSNLTPLTVASIYFMTEAVDLLISLGADVNAVDKEGDCALMKISSATDERGVTIAEKLFNAGADINLANNLGETPLFKAAECGKIELVKLLVENGADVNAVNNYGRSPIFKSIYSRTEDVMELLLRHGADPDIRDNSGQTALLCTCGEFGGGESRERILQKIKCLLEAGANINAADQLGKTALYKLMTHRGDYPDIVISCAEILLKYGADVNSVTTDGSIPFHKAVEYKNHKIIDFFIANGADINKVAHNGLTPLHNICITGDKELIEKLILAGADMNIKRKKGAIYDSPFISALHYNTAVVINSMISLGGDVNQLDLSGRSPLILAASRGFISVIERLIRAGADVSAVNSTGQTYLDLLQSWYPKKYKQWVYGSQKKIQKKVLRREDAVNTVNTRREPDFFL